MISLLCVCVIQDNGDEFTYSGSGGRDLSGNKRRGEKNSRDLELKAMNKYMGGRGWGREALGELLFLFRALAKNCYVELGEKKGATATSWRSGKPVRVVSH